MRISIVLSTRPEIIKLSPIIQLLEKKNYRYNLINTNQHTSKNMSEDFFKIFNIKKKKITNLNIPNKSQNFFIAESVKKISKLLIKKKPNFLMVQGDTNTSLAGCIAASIVNRNLKIKQKIKIAHVEAGLRSFDNDMPEEINRKLIDELSDILFIPTRFDYKNLEKENKLKKKKYFVVGNTISDVLRKYVRFSDKSLILKKLSLRKKNYFLFTAHRPESVDSYDNIKNILEILNKIIKNYKIHIVFPIHPRTRKIIKRFKLRLNSNIKIIEPLNYFDFIKLLKNTKILLTDSGGLQEEAAILEVPCITLRTSTERQITVLKKINYLAGYNKNKVINGINKFRKININKIDDFGNGYVAKKIINCLEKLYIKY